MSEFKKDQSDPPRSRSTSPSSMDSESAAPRSRAESRPQSLTGSLRSRLRSLSSHGMNQVDRVHSGRHINDQSIYHSDESNDEEESIEGGDTSDTIQEVRNGIANERDLDLEKSRQPELEKTRTAKSNQSRHDPKLVSFYHNLVRVEV